MKNKIEALTTAFNIGFNFKKQSSNKHSIQAALKNAIELGLSMMPTPKTDIGFKDRLKFLSIQPCQYYDNMDCLQTDKCFTEYCPVCIGKALFKEYKTIVIGFEEPPEVGNETL